MAVAGYVIGRVPARVLVRSGAAAAASTLVYLVYLRPIIQQHKAYVLSTQTADELDILHLADVVMSVDAAQIVGRQSAPPEEGASKKDRAWFFKLFSLRGMDGEVERMCFFTYLQKSDDDEW